MNLSPPFRPVPTEATIGGYKQDNSIQALRQVYSVEAAFGWAKRCFHRYETGGEPGLSWVVCSCQLAPRWGEPSGSENIGEMLHRVANRGFSSWGFPSNLACFAIGNMCLNRFALL